MYQQHSNDIVIIKNNRNAQSANKSRGRDSPYNLYQNLTHKNSSQSKEHTLFPNNKITSNRYFQPSIDVNELNNSSQFRHSHKRIKTEVNRSTNLNNRISPKVLTVLLNKIAIQKTNQNTLNKISTNVVNRLRTVKLNQARVQRDIQDRHNKQSIQSELKEQHLIRANNYLIINSQVNYKDKTSDEISQLDYQQKQRNDSISNTDSKQLKQSIFKQIQDFNQTKLDQIHLTKQEDQMKFSFGFQSNQIKSIKKFPKDIFYNDVRKAKKYLSNQ